MAVEVVDYTPPHTGKFFIRDYLPGELFYDWIVGPLGSGKTTTLFFKLAFMAKQQERGPDGTRRTRAVVVRSTMPQLKDTTIKSWFTWFRDGVAGKWKATEKDFLLKFDDVECEVLFRPLDTEEDIARVLSLELSFAIIDEFIQVPKAIVDALSGRLGRFPAAKDGGCTNWGMWGSSNPGTEDNWWYDYLHNEGEYARGKDGSANVERIELFGSPEHKGAMAALARKAMKNTNVRYFQQPSGFHADAENLDNLPGGRGYYVNQAKGKSSAWIKQFVDAEWGFSASETPVVKTFQPNIHVSRSGVLYQPVYYLVGGFDPGLSGTCMVFGQEDMHGRLLVMGEVGAVGMGATRFITERVKPYLRHRFPNAQVIVAPDPASANRGQNDEVAVVQTVRKHFDNVVIETNNQLAKRLDAIESYTGRLTEMGPALLIDKDACPMTVRALSGGWRFGRMTKGDQTKPAPEKNSYSHYGDAFGYLARYFHRQYERTKTRGAVVPLQGHVPAYGRQQLPSYHQR